MSKIEELAAKCSVSKLGHRCLLHPDIVKETGAVTDANGEVYTFGRECPQCLIEAVEEYKSQVKECKCGQ